MILGNNWRRLSLDNSDISTSFHKVRWVLVVFAEAVDIPSLMRKIIIVAGLVQIYINLYHHPHVENYGFQ